MIRILLATENATDREHIVALLESNPEHTVIGQAENGIEAVELATRLIMERMPTRIVVLSSGEDAPDLGRGAEALRAGALTVVPKPVGRGPFSDLRQEIFLEMVRAAIRKDLRVPPIEPAQDSLGASWMRPATGFAHSFDPEQLAADFDVGYDLIGLPLTVEDRATRIRRLMDDIR